MGIYCCKLREPASKGKNKKIYMGTDDHSPKGIGELHGMAIELGIPMEGFDDSDGNPHYCVFPNKVGLAFRLGAVMVEKDEYYRRCVAINRNHGSARMTHANG